MWGDVFPGLRIPQFMNLMSVEDGKSLVQVKNDLIGCYWAYVDSTLCFGLRAQGGNRVILNPRLGRLSINRQGLCRVAIPLNDVQIGYLPSDYVEMFHEFGGDFTGGVHPKVWFPLREFKVLINDERMSRYRNPGKIEVANQEYFGVPPVLPIAIRAPDHNFGLGRDILTEEEIREGVRKKSHEQTVASLRERQLQIILKNQLEQEFPGQLVIAEFNTGYGTRSDLAVKHGDQYDLYEIKALPTLKECVRQAFGQLMEYAYWCSRKDWVRTLYIASDHPSDSCTEEYIGFIRSEFGIRIYYRQIKG